MARLYLLYDVESIRLRAMTPAEAHKYVCHSDGSECDAAVSECVAAEAPMRLYDEAHREEAMSEALRWLYEDDGEEADIDTSDLSEEPVAQDDYVQCLRERR